MGTITILIILAIIIIAGERKLPEKDRTPIGVVILGLLLFAFGSAIFI